MLLPLHNINLCLPGRHGIRTVNYLININIKVLTNLTRGWGYPISNPIRRCAHVCKRYTDGLCGRVWRLACGSFQRRFRICHSKVLSIKLSYPKTAIDHPRSGKYSTIFPNSYHCRCVIVLQSTRYNVI
jgi:hypothetical protein